MLFGTGADEDGGVFLPPYGCAILYLAPPEPQPEPEPEQGEKEMPEPQETVQEADVSSLTASELASRGPVSKRI